MQKAVFNPLASVTPAYQNKAKAKLDSMKATQKVTNVDLETLPTRDGDRLRAFSPQNPLQRLGELKPHDRTSFDAVNVNGQHTVPLQGHRYARNSK
jgi:hypothetical protein